MTNVDGAPMRATNDEVQEMIKSLQEQLSSECEEPNHLLTEGEQRLIEPLMEILEIAEVQEAAASTDAFDFRVRSIWNNKEDGCTVRIAENFQDRVAYIRLKDVDEMLLACKNGGRAYSILLRYDIRNEGAL